MRIAYNSPFIPPELLAAHGAEPLRLVPAPEAGDASAAPVMGTCPFARAVAGAVIASDGLAAAVLAATCDQTRRAAEWAHLHAKVPVFRMHVPATWQTPAAARAYLDELRRLARFLVRLGGQAADADRLWSVMERYDADRAAVRAAAGRALPEARGGVPVAVVGGPVMRGHERVFEAVAEAGGRVVLNATETGLRTLPTPFDRRRRSGDDPWLALVDAYFGGIADVFQRPDGRLMDALVHDAADAGARGIILWRYVWCDLWAALAERLREAAGVPVLALDVAADAASLRQAAGRIQAFLEVLR